MGDGDATRPPRIGAVAAWVVEPSAASPSAHGSPYASSPASLASPRRRLGRHGFSSSTFAAFVCFGLASWVMTNTTLVELSHFMLRLPERLAIFPYASANVYPILYMWLNANHQRLSLVNAVWLCLFLALIVSVLMSCFWDQTTRFLGQDHSVAMLVLTHIGGIVSAVTSVIFYPYVATFPPIYTSALSTGEGLSGTLVGLLGLWQKPYADELTFSVSSFYVACVIIVAASLCAFAYLEYHPSSSIERKRIAPSDRERHKVHTYDSAFVDTEADARDMPSACSLRQRVFEWFSRELLCQALLGLVFYGVLPSISSFLFARYSPNDLARAAKHQTIASTVIFFVDPLARFATSFCQLYTVYLSTVILLALGVTMIVCTLLTNPPLSSDQDGFFFPLVMYITSSGIYSYTQTMLVLAVKQQADFTRDAVFAEAAYMWSGFAIQMGAFVGTIIVFPLTLAYPEYFQSAP